MKNPNSGNQAWYKGNSGAKLWRNSEMAETHYSRLVNQGKATMPRPEKQPTLISLKYQAVCARCRIDLMPNEQAYFEKPAGAERGKVTCTGCQNNVDAPEPDR